MSDINQASVWPPQLGDLAAAVLAGEAPRFHPNTGDDLSEIEDVALHPSARAGLDAPRFCQICGRRMVVQIRPDGWLATCSRHGDLDSVLLDR
ncbi:MAG: hypothetical protein SOW59_01040 [Corynebacterium sp.]|nr:hypothetical protein [Corynebacterium sp.]